MEGNIWCNKPDDYNAFCLFGCSCDKCTYNTWSAEAENYFKEVQKHPVIITSKPQNEYQCQAVAAYLRMLAQEAEQASHEEL